MNEREMLYTWIDSVGEEHKRTHDQVVDELTELTELAGLKWAGAVLMCLGIVV